MTPGVTTPAFKATRLRGIVIVFARKGGGGAVQSPLVQVYMALFDTPIFKKKKKVRIIVLLTELICYYIDNINYN